MKYLHQIPRIGDGIDHLLEKDPVFSKLGVDLAELKWPYIGPGFPALVRIAIGQQVSTQAAASMWQRFTEGVPTVSPNAILVLKDDDMRSFGLSYQKAKYIRGLAEAVKKNEFSPEALDKLSDDKVFETITALHGFGRWSADMYLMFGLARPDVWPAGDLGIQTGLQRYLNLKDRPPAAQTLKEGARFAPHRTAAAILLWHLKIKTDKDAG
jgi:DNA-3-methyladenine glycosylase II